MQHDSDRSRRTEASALSLVSEATVSAFEEAQTSFERFCLAAGMEALLEEDATSVCGRRYGRERWQSRLPDLRLFCSIWRALEPIEPTC
jgi:hypothetical protein